MTNTTTAISPENIFRGTTFLYEGERHTAIREAVRTGRTVFVVTERRALTIPLFKSLQRVAY